MFYEKIEVIFQKHPTLFPKLSFVVQFFLLLISHCLKVCARPNHTDPEQLATIVQAVLPALPQNIVSESTKWLAFKFISKNYDMFIS